MRTVALGLCENGRPPFKEAERRIERLADLKKGPSSQLGLSGEKASSGIRLLVLFKRAIQVSLLMELENPHRQYSRSLIYIKLSWAREHQRSQG